MAAKDSAERAAKRLESDAQFSTGKKKDFLTSKAEQARGEAALQEAKIKKLESELGLNKPNQAVGDLAKSKQAQTPTGAQAAQAMTEEKKKEIASTQTDPGEIPGVTVNPKPTQESAETLLAQLNTKLDELIMINRKVADLNDSQLRVQKNMGNDLYA